MHWTQLLKYWTHDTDYKLWILYNYLLTATVPCMVPSGIRTTDRQLATSTEWDYDDPSHHSLFKFKWWTTYICQSTEPQWLQPISKNWFIFVYITVFDDKTCQILTHFFLLFRVTFWLRERSPVPWERHWVPRAWTRWWFLPTMTSQLPTTERQFSSWWMLITRYLFFQVFLPCVL